MFAVCIYTALFAVYEIWIRREGGPASVRPISDVFSDLTFRERYNDLLNRTGRDVLTGVYDRTRMEMDAPVMVREALRQGQFVTVIILDADHFKDVNDRFGHLQGDEVLKAITLRLGTILRSADRVFRFGGEEFVAVCPATDHAEECVLPNACAGRSQAASRRRTETRLPSASAWRQPIPTA